LAYGTIVNAFCDYFQMGESTMHLCLLHFIFCVLQNDEYCSMYLRTDAKHVEAIYYEEHGIHGMAGSLYCSHVCWNNYLITHHGQFKAKAEKPTTIMEVACDYQLYAYHAIIGYSWT
jgi:hypothetical protein